MQKIEYKGLKKVVKSNVPPAKCYQAIPDGKSG